MILTPYTALPRPNARRYFRLSASTLPFDVYVISMEGATDRLASFQRSYAASGVIGGAAAASSCCIQPLR